MIFQPIIKNNMKPYLHNPCHTVTPIFNTNNSPNLNIDLRKPINTINSFQLETKNNNIKNNNYSKNTKELYTRREGNSDILNNRIQDFSLLSSSRAYPLIKNRIIPENKPKSTRGEPFK
jgi:hypothetical protein